MTIRVAVIDDIQRRELKTPTRKELPSWLQKHRKTEGLSYQELANALSKRANTPVSRQSVHNWETGAATPSPDHLALLVAHFGGSDYVGSAIAVESAPPTVADDTA